MKRLMLISLTLAAFVAAPSYAAPVRCYYTGSIGKNIPVQMDITINGSTVTGDYYYTKNGQPLDLKGTINASGTATVKELLDSGKSTGTFTGRFNTARTSWSGTWTSSDGKRKMPFNARAVAKYTIIKTEKEKIDTSVSYPQFITTSPALAEINRRIKQDLKTKQDTFRKQARELHQDPDLKDQIYGFGYDSRVAYYSPTLVSLAIEDYQFTGGAHPMTYFTAANYRISKGQVQKLKLTDLFKPGSGYEQFLSNTILAQLRKKDAQWVTQGEVKKIEIKDLDSFTIIPQGLTFYFDPYEMGPYAQGFFTATVPYKSLGPYVRKPGPLDQFK